MMLSDSVVHLFRHLSEPEALRSNPLVADIFARAAGKTSAERNAAAISEIRKRLERCAECCERLDAGTRHETRGKRHRAIITRCDLAGERHENVAHELGICIRHFYRERRAAQQRVAQLLGEQHQASSVVMDAHEAVLAHASMLAELGCSTDAIAELGSVAGTVSGETKVRVLAKLADTLRNFGYTERARETLRAATDETNAMRNGSGTVIEQLWLRSTEAELLSECGAFDDAERAYTETATLLPRATNTGSTVADDAVIHASRALGYRAYRRGDPREAEHYTMSALRVLARSSQPTLLVRESLMHVQILSLYQLGAITCAQAQYRLRELLRFAQSAGSLEQSASLLCSLSVSEKAPLNESYRSQARVLAYRHGSTYMRRHVHLAAATWLLANGNPSQAIVEMNEAKKHGVGDVGQQIMTLDIEARASLFAGDLGTAQKYSRRAHRLAAAVGDERARGAVMRTMAMAELRLGHLRDARALISEAIPVITSHGSPSSLNLALALRERIDRSSRLARP